ncbi:efflux transporter outer membrane subunit [Undibacterium sp. Jales W-56]|uniref:efflux transporter outer membrane subunit n=1 Tax=Undibacterium sp. Jales W-56 TaxID=2897325 RepID=UPI0021D11435|nr:efflux transporter outer membrane subunit [Undibacterium sp. Jales W-56]MCU6433405.1 efflux transporter outer membrane subunit [Undibacterium sp. Jales W-56]
MKLTLKRQSWLQLAMASSLMLTLPGCANFTGIQSNAQLRSLPSSTPATNSPAVYWQDANWAQQIGGKDLQSLIETAITDNPGLQVAAARIASAKAIIEATGANDKVSVNASLDSTYQRFTEHGMIPPPLAGSTKSNNQIALNFAYELDFWGKHSAEMRSALSQEKVALAEQQSAKLMLSTAIAHAWVQLARQYEQLELSTRQLAVRNKLDELTRQRVKAGLDTSTDIQQSLIQSSTLQADINQWQEAIVLTRNQLAALSGQSPEHGLLIAKPVLNALVNTSLPEQLPLALLGRKADIVAARWRVEAIQGEVDVAKTQFYPNINLIGFAGVSSLGLPNLFQSGSTIIGAGPAIRLPIFEGGRLRAQLKGKVASYDAAVATYNQSLTDAMREVADQVQSLKTIEAQDKNQRIAEAAAVRTIDLAQQRQRAGTANMLPVLAAENIRLMQQKLLLDIQIRRTDLQINLIKALGGGYDLPAALQMPQQHPQANNSTHSHPQLPINAEAA